MQSLSFIHSNTSHLARNEKKTHTTLVTTSALCFHSPLFLFTARVVSCFDLLLPKTFQYRHYVEYFLSFFSLLFDVYAR